MVLLAWCSHAADAGADDEISAALESCDGAVYPLPRLTAQQLTDLAAGQVVKIVHHAADPEAPSSAIGIAVLAAPREALWVSAQDIHEEVDPSMVEFVVRSLGGDHDLWYGHIDLPRPITDRQWVVESENNHALAPGCWEHHWALVNDGIALVRDTIESGTTKVTTAQLNEAIYTPVNRGNWLMAPLPDGRTVVSYQATSVIGGAIPDWLVLQLTMSRLDSVLRSLEHRAQSWVPGHYRGDHQAIYGGDGSRSRGTRSR